MGKKRGAMETIRGKAPKKAGGKAQVLGSSSQQSPPKRMKSKRKEIAVEHSESEDDELERNELRTTNEEDNEEENEEEMARKRKAKGKAVSKEQASKRPTYAQYMSRFKEIKFVATRYPDPAFLLEAGLLGEVETILEEMGLTGLVSKAHDTYVDLTKEFLASLTAETEMSETDWDEPICMHFKIGRKKYSVNAHDLYRIYGLSRGKNLTPATSRSECTDIWEIIGEGPYKKSLTKSANIRHPAIRYAHKVLATTFFARRETGSITTHDMAYLMVGIKPFLRSYDEGNGIRTNRYNVSMATAFVNYLVDLQDWTITTKDKTPQVSIGGLLTPIFIDKGIELKGETLKPTRVDKYYLAKNNFLAGSLADSYAYRFKISASQEAKILLPQPNLTSFLFEENIAFKHGSEHWYIKAKHGALEKIRMARQEATEAQLGETSEQEPPQLQMPAGPVYGSARYDFDPYDDPINTSALRQAHEHIHLLQRFIKWQGKSLHKVVKQVKNLKIEMKSLKEKFSGAGCSNPQPN